jgi:hypothetical protein
VPQVSISLFNDHTLHTCLCSFVVFCFSVVCYFVMCIMWSCSTTITGWNSFAVKTNNKNVKNNKINLHLGLTVSCVPVLQTALLASHSCHHCTYGKVTDNTRILLLYIQYTQRHILHFNKNGIKRPNSVEFLVPAVVTTNPMQVQWCFEGANCPYLPQQRVSQARRWRQYFPATLRSTWA